MTLHASGMVEVMGESYRPDVLRLLAARTTYCTPYIEELSGMALERAKSDTGLRWLRAALLREPRNEHDTNAIAVYADSVGRVGHLSRDDAVEYLPIFAELRRRGCSVAACPAFLTGGEKGMQSYGVMLCLSTAELVIRHLNETPAYGRGFAWPGELKLHRDGHTPAVSAALMIAKGIERGLDAIALTPTERDAIQGVRDDVPDGLVELRSKLARDHASRREPLPDG